MTNLVGPLILVLKARIEARPTATTIKISKAKTHLSDLLARVEAGEEFVIARGNNPVAHLTAVRKQTDLQLLLAEVRVARQKAAMSTNEEILSWRDEGRR